VYGIFVIVICLSYIVNLLTHIDEFVVVLRPNLRLKVDSNLSLPVAPKSRECAYGLHDLNAMKSVGRIKGEDVFILKPVSNKGGFGNERNQAQI